MRYMELAAGLAGIVLITWSFAGGTARADAAQTAGTVKEFTVVAERFTFTPARLEVNQGDHVKVTVKSADGTHGFAIKKLKVDVTVPKGGAPVVAEFDATQPGTYTISCSEYCGRGHSHMKGELVVHPAPHH